MDPEPVERDSRGILDPWLLRRRIQLTRYPVGPGLAGLVDRFWAVRWDLPPGTVHEQSVLTHPCANISVGGGPGLEFGSLQARLSGVTRRLTTRVMAGRGWTVAAMTTPGGLGGFLGGPVRRFNDAYLPLGDALGTDDAALVAAIAAAADETARVEVLAAFIADVLAGADPARVRVAREVAAVARLAETDRSLRRLDDLCTLAGVGPRSLQRMFSEYAGVSPTWVLRRYRLLDAAEAVRDGTGVSWAELAAELGYADQAHLTREFRAAIGSTPAAYALAQSRR